MGPGQAYCRVGLISKPHGVHGEFVLHLESDFPQWLAQRKAFFVEIEGAMRPWRVESARFHHGKLLLKVSGLQNPEAVKAMRGAALYVPDVEARSAVDDPNYFFNADLVGLAVIGADRKRLGAVIDVYEMPGHNLLEVEKTEGGTFQIPFAKAFIREVDLASGRLLVELPEGLININEE